MKKSLKLLLSIVILSLVLGLAITAKAESLWTDQSSTLISKKPRNFQVGDLLTIVVIEQAKATQEAKTSNGEKGSISAGAGSGALKNIVPQVGADWNNSFDGTGTTTRGGSLIAKITVQVKEINPNGIMQIEGRQVIKINKEDQVLTVSGSVRTEDVTSDNIIMSSYIANAVIEYQGKGSVGAAQEPGILTRFFQWVF